MYRAQSDEDYPMANVNTGDLAGVMWYLHNEVLSLCPRKYSISRVLRMKVMLRTPLMPYVAFDNGKCTVPGCERIWRRHGYAVGCQNGPNYGSAHGHWFSLPGPCPSTARTDKSVACAEEQPGGACRRADDLTLNSTCTYYTEPAGEIDLSDLVGIHDYGAFCRAGSLEYDKATDRGRGLGFWDGFQRAARCGRRLERVQGLFRRRYPELPEELEQEPSCYGLR